MRKRASAAALGIRLTAMPVFAAILVASILQVVAFLVSQTYWTSEVYDWAYSFDMILEEKFVAFTGKMSFLGIMAVLGVTAGSAKSRIGYTIRRLRIGENELTGIWALIFSGYFLISWGVQLALVLGMLARYAQVTGWGAMELFTSSFRSDYFHMLLPLAEPLGYVRNVFLCLGWGTMGALLGRSARHGGKIHMAFALIVISAVLLIPEVATASADVMLCVAMVVIILVQTTMIKGVEQNED